MNVNSNFMVSSKNILGLDSNTRKLKWSWGSNVPLSSESEFAACKVKIRLRVDDEVSRSIPGGIHDGKYHYFSGATETDSVAYSRTLLGGRLLQFRLSGLAAGNPVMTVNRDYMRFVSHRFMNLHSIGYILTDLAALQLLRSGYCPLHCSAFSVGDATVLVLAPPNTGKTLTTMVACADFGAEFIAEDLAITDGTQLFSVPWTSTFRYYERVDSSRRSRMLNAATAVVPLVELLPLGSTSSIDTILPSKQMADDRKITHVVVLERGGEDIRELSVPEAHRKAVNLNRYEFNYTKSPTLVAYEFFNPILDLDEAARAERRVLAQVVESAVDRFVVTSLDPTRYAGMILDRVSS